MRKPLLIAGFLSLLLHAAVVLAFVAMPGQPVPPHPAEAPASVTLGPDFVSPADEPQPPAPAPLTAAPPPPEAAAKTPEPPNVVASEAPPPAPAQSLSPAEAPPVVPETRTVSIPPIAPPALPEGTPDAPAPTDVPAEAPAAEVAAPESSARTSEPEASAATAAPAAAASSGSPDETRADAGSTTLNASAPAQASGAPEPESAQSGPAAVALAETAPQQGATTEPAAPIAGQGTPSLLAPAIPSLFPSGGVPGLASSSAPPAALTLPVISSDDGGATATNEAAQALSATELPAVSDVGPAGEAAEGSLGQAARTRTFIPPPLHHGAAPQRGHAGERAGRARRGVPGGTGEGEIYDPSVRARYSSQLFGFLRRRLVFPATGERGTATVRFILDRSGQIERLTLVGSSGSPTLDEQALAIVRRAAPFPRFPQGFGSSQLEVTLPVTFK